jgi:hypothetical protein
MIPFYAACAFALALLIILCGARIFGHPGTPYRRGRFLSPNEKSFLSCLDAALGPHYRVFTQVRLAELVEVSERVGGAKKQAALNRVFGKSVDFVVCEAITFEPIAVIEVDDRTHLLPGRQARDAVVNAVFAEIGLPLLRVPARRVYSAASIREMMGSAGIQSRAVQPVFASEEQTRKTLS